MNQIKTIVWDWVRKNTSTISIASIILAIGTLLIDFRKEERFDHQDLLNEFRLEVMRLREIEATCNKSLLQNSKDIASLQQKLIMLESATMDLPLPMWLKSIGTEDRPGQMLVLNKAYEEAYLNPFGKTMYQYIGKTDRDFWGPELGDSYWQMDLEVIRSKRKIDKMETSPLGGKVRVIKYPRFYHGQLIGIAGIAIPQYE